MQIFSLLRFRPQLSVFMLIVKSLRWLFDFCLADVVLDLFLDARFKDDCVSFEFSVFLSWIQIFGKSGSTPILYIFLNKK